MGAVRTLAPPSRGLYNSPAFLFSSRVPTTQIDDFAPRTHYQIIASLSATGGGRDPNVARAVPSAAREDASRRPFTCMYAGKTPRACRPALLRPRRRVQRVAVRATPVAALGATFRNSGNLFATHISSQTFFGRGASRNYDAFRKSASRATFIPENEQEAAHISAQRVYFSAESIKSSQTTRAGRRPFTSLGEDDTAIRTRVRLSRRAGARAPSGAGWHLRSASNAVLRRTRVGRPTRTRWEAIYPEG